MIKFNDSIFLLISAALGSFLTPFMSSSVNISLPLIGREYNLNAIELNWIATSFLLSSAIFLIPFGRLSDIVGRKKIFVWGIVIFIITTSIITIINNVVLLILLRFAQGIGGSMLFCTATALVSSNFSVDKRGKALGVLVTSVYLGISLGPILGGYITQYFGWRTIFFLNAFLGVIALIFALKKIKDDHPISKEEKFDLVGSIIYGISLVSLMYGFSKLPSVLGIIMSCSGIIGILVFFLYEKKISYPALNVNLLLNNKVFALSNISALINYAATFAIGFLLSLYLQYIKGFSPKDAGIILIAQPIIMTIFSPTAGKLSDKIEPRIISSIGMFLTSVGLLLLIFIDENTNNITIISDLIIVGLGFALFSSPNMNAIMSSIDKKYYGVGSAMQGTMRLVGQMFSMGIVMIIFSIIAGNVQITSESHPNLMQSIKFAFLTFTVLCTFGIFTSLVRGKVR